MSRSAYGPSKGIDKPSDEHRVSRLSGVRYMGDAWVRSRLSSRGDHDGHPLFFNLVIRETFSQRSP